MADYKTVKLNQDDDYSSPLPTTSPTSDDPFFATSGSKTIVDGLFRRTLKLNDGREAYLVAEKKSMEGWARGGGGGKKTTETTAEVVPPRGDNIGAQIDSLDPNFESSALEIRGVLLLLHPSCPPALESTCSNKRMLAERLSHDTSPSVVIMPDLTGDESEDDVKGLVEECRGYLEEVNAGTTNIMASGDMVEFAGHYADASSVVLWRPTKTLKRDVKEQVRGTLDEETRPY